VDFFGSGAVWKKTGMAAFEILALQAVRFFLIDALSMPLIRLWYALSMLYSCRDIETLQIL